jgi:DNA-binding MarR family transcriptional regulator
MDNVPNMEHMFQKENDLDVVLELLNGSKHLRSLAEDIGLPASTTKRSLDSLVKENVLDARMEGKNRIFSIRKNLEARHYVLAAESYKALKCLRKYPKIIPIIDEALKVCEGMVVLFGSHANFTAKTGSDIDLYAFRGKVRGASVKNGEFGTGSPLVKEIVKKHVIFRGVEEFYERTGFFEESR